MVTVLTQLLKQGSRYSDTQQPPFSSRKLYVSDALLLERDRGVDSTYLEHLMSEEDCGAKVEASTEEVRGGITVIVDRGDMCIVDESVLGEFERLVHQLSPHLGAWRVDRVLLEHR